MSAILLDGRLARALSLGTGVRGEDDRMSIALRGEVPLDAFRHVCSDPGICPEDKLMVWGYD